VFGCRCSVFGWWCVEAGVMGGHRLRARARPICRQERGKVELLRMVNARRFELRYILPTILPGTVVAIAYLLLLGYRRDYLGHYAAGFGGTLTALALIVGEIAPEHFQRRSPLIICIVVVGCILAGAFAEATLYNIAKFDEVDFCNQSLGAVLAGIGLLSNFSDSKPPPRMFRANCYAGLVALHIGFFFAIF
jgi:hypothetical protein